MRVFAKMSPFAVIGKALKEVEKSYLDNSKEALINSTLAIHSHAVKSLQENSDGPAQMRYNPTRQVNVSRPGDPPNTDTGRAVQSIQFEFSKGGFSSRVGSNLKYLLWLEFGTSKMEARPWLAPAVAASAQLVKEFFEKAVKKVSKK